MIRTLFLLLAITSPVAAQDALTAETVFSTFKTRCQTIAADPEGAVSATFNGDGSASGAVTSDKAITQYQAAIELPGADFASIFYIRHQLPGGSMSFCGLTVSLSEAVTPIAFPEMADLIGVEAEGLLGAPVTRRGSDVMENGEIGRMFLWTAGDSPNDPSFLLQQSPRLLQLSLQLSAPPN
jgi:hypothetical protein